MGTEGILQEIESALGKRHPQADALIWQRVDFICDEIKQLRSRRTKRAAYGLLGGLSDEEIKSLSKLQAVTRGASPRR